MVGVTGSDEHTCEFLAGDSRVFPALDEHAQSVLPARGRGPATQPLCQTGCRWLRTGITSSCRGRTS
jgi:hypothetical protein